MAKKCKDYYDAACAQMLADRIRAVCFEFDAQRFVRDLSRDLPRGELLQRQDFFVVAFERYLPLPYEEVVTVFTRILGPELPTTQGMYTCGWWLWPLARYVEKHGTKNVAVSLVFVNHLTKRFTGEFAVRPLIEARPRQTLRVLRHWSRSANVHVRRLASEGMRIRLPWARKLYAAVNEFDLFCSILDNLREDKEMFVRKSVGNNLNDLMKEDPGKAHGIIARWERGKPAKETLWIIRHGTRSLRKGAGAHPAVRGGAG